MSEWSLWTEQLKTALADYTSHRRNCLSPDIAFGRHRGPARHDARRSAVLIAFHDHSDGPRFALTRRAAQLKSHAGQISLPGGKVERGETLEEAAVREFVEELRPEAGDAAVRVLGKLPEVHVFVSNFRMATIVAAVDDPGEYRPNPDEVGGVHWVSLADLRDDRRWSRPHTIQRGKLTFHAPAFRLEDDSPVWGATCLALQSLRHVCDVVDGAAAP